MSTRGTAYFEIQETPESEPIKVGRIGISHDGYPSGFGYIMCTNVQDIFVADNIENFKDRPKNARVFPNTERVILYLLYHTKTDYLYDDEYIYRFIFAPLNMPGSIYRVADNISVEVIHKYEDNNFAGSFEEFKLFCDWPV
jgi:hypothetical protein